MLILAAVLLLAGAFAGASVGTSLELLGGGGLLLVVGVSMIAARLVPSIVKVVGAPARRLGGVPGRLARTQRPTQPHTDGYDRGRPDDRACAGDARRHTGQRAACLGPRGIEDRSSSQTTS